MKILARYLLGCIEDPSQGEEHLTISTYLPLQNSNVVGTLCLETRHCLIKQRMSDHDGARDRKKHAYGCSDPPHPKTRKAEFLRTRPGMHGCGRAIEWQFVLPIRAHV